jgi:hypothetical protein
MKNVVIFGKHPIQNIIPISVFVNWCMNDVDCIWKGSPLIAPSGFRVWTMCIIIYKLCALLLFINYSFSTLHSTLGI